MADTAILPSSGKRQSTAEEEIDAKKPKRCEKDAKRQLTAEEERIAKKLRRCLAEAKGKGKMAKEMIDKFRAEYPEEDLRDILDLIPPSSSSSSGGKRQSTGKEERDPKLKMVSEMINKLRSEYPEDDEQDIVNILYLTSPSIPYPSGKIHRRWSWDEKPKSESEIFQLFKSEYDKEEDFFNIMHLIEEYKEEFSRDDVWAKLFDYVLRNLPARLKDREDDIKGANNPELALFEMFGRELETAGSDGSPCSFIVDSSDDSLDFQCMLCFKDHEEEDCPHKDNPC